jgi:opacity protein-like surface antigen
MTKSCVIPAAVLLCAGWAAAQDVPRVETFAGFSFVRFSSATDAPSFNASGGSGQFAYNLNRWLGAVADLGAVNTSSISGAAIDNTTMNFLFGPRISFRQPRLRPYVQILWGGVYNTASTAVNVEIPGALPGQPVTARLVTSDTAFAMTIGGGLDFKLSKHVSFRPVGVDYYMTRLQNLRTQGDNNQHNFRYTTGFNFTFGAQ